MPLLTLPMEDTNDIVIEKLRRQRANLRFSELAKVCDRFFGKPRQEGTSHRVYRTPWPGDPRVNIQDDNGQAKPYQVLQVIKAIEKLHPPTEEPEQTRELDEK